MAILLTGTTIGGHSAIHAGNLATHGIVTTSNIGSYALTSITSGNVTTALGYTPYNATNPSAYITSSNNYYYVNPGSGYGLGFWGQVPTTYGITMANESAGYGVIYGLSEYHLYFSMTGGGNRGFVFRNDAHGAVTQIGAYGWQMWRGELYPGYNNGGSGSQTSYYIYGNTNSGGIRTNGNWIVNGDIYLGTRDAWLSTWLNQAVKTDSNPTFASIYLNGTQLTGTQTQLLKNTLDVSSLPYKCDIYVEGDANTFYPVHFMYGDQDVWRRIIIKRGYYEDAPWDPIGTGAHHGGLLLDWEGNFGGWGGAEYSDRLRVFNQSYTDVCADMYIHTHSMGYVFMLRGGHAIYHIYSDQPIRGYYQEGTPDIAYSTATKFYNGGPSYPQYDVYAPAPLTLAQVNSSRIDGLRTKKQSLLDGRYLRQGVDIGSITNISASNFMAANAFYLNGQSYYLNSYNGGIYTNARFESGNSIHSVNFYAGDWFRNNSSNTGLYNQTNGNHFYSRGATSWGMTFAGNSSGAFGFWRNHESSEEGNIYFNTEGFGLLNRNGNWALRTDRDSTNVRLFYAGSERLRTDSSGAYVTGRLDVSSYIYTPQHIIAKNIQGPFQVLNLDTIKEPGLYQYDGGINGTQPLDTNWYNVKTIEIGNDSRYSQFVMPYNNNRIFYRHHVSSTWQPYVELITSGNIGSQSVSYATTAGALSSMNISQFTNNSGYITSFTETNTFLADGGSGDTHPGTGRLIFTGQLSSGTPVLGMPATDNSNAFLNINRHSGEYNSQLGFSSNGNMYYRSFSATAINSSQAWRQVWDSGNLTNLNQLTNGPGYITSSALSGYATQSYVNSQGFLTSLPSHNHDDRYYTETEINNFSYWRNNEERTIKILRFTGEGGDSANTTQSYAIYQAGGAWTHPYPDLRIAFHTGIQIGANSSYGGTRFYNEYDMATELMSVGNGDNHVRVANNLYMGGNLVATQSWVGSQGYLTSLPSHNHDDRYYTETESDGRYIQYGSLSNSFGLNDNKLYLRTNGDTNHYLWNAADDWEELVYYSGTGFRVKGSTGTVPSYFTENGIYASAYRGKDNVGGTGTASWHPDGIYCGSTMWQYGSLNKNNTGIYDVSEIKMYGGLYLQTYNDRNLIVKGNSSSDAGIEGRNAAGSNVFQIYGEGTNYGFLNGTWAAWDLKKTKNGALYMNDNNSYYLQTNSTSNFVALNIQGNAVVHAGNIGSQSVSYASSAGSVAWTNVSSRPTALSQFTNDLGNYGGWITSSGSISGSAGSVSGLTLTSSGNGINPDSVTQNQIGYNTSVSLFGQTDGGLYSSAYSSAWIHQIYGDFRTGQIAIRGKNSGSWQAWRTVLDSSNYTSYAPGLTGSGASGTWGINVTGSAGSVAWTNVSSRPTNLSQFTNDLGNYGGWITSSGSISGNAATATNVAWTGVTGRPTALSQFSNDLGNYGGFLTSLPAHDHDRVFLTDSRGASRAPSYYDQRYAQWDFQNNGDTGAGGDSWHGLLTVAKWFSYDASHRQEQLAFTGDDLKRRTATSDSAWGSWKTIIDTGNVGSQSVNYANSAGSATTAGSATSASQLNKYGDIYGQDWNTYYVQDKLIAAAVYGHSGANRPNLTYDYGVALSYGEATGPRMQMYFPENSSNQGTIFRKGTYRTGWNGNWSTWKTFVEQEGNICTIVGGVGAGLEVHGNPGYNQDPLTYFLLRGAADTSWKALKVRLTGDAGGQDIEFRRIAENGADSRMWYVPRGGNTVNFEYPIVQPSDSRLKDNITPISTPVDKIKSLRGVEFDWNSGEQVGTHDVGLIAQDVEAVLPEAVTTQEDGYKNLAYTKVIPLLVEAMKEQQAMIEALKAEIELLKNK